MGVSTLERNLSFNPGHDEIKLIWCDNIVSFDNSFGNGMLGFSKNHMSLFIEEYLR